MQIVTLSFRPIAIVCLTHIFKSICGYMSTFPSTPILFSKRFPFDQPELSVDAANMCLYVLLLAFDLFYNQICSRIIKPTNIAPLVKVMRL